MSDPIDPKAVDKRIAGRLIHSGQLDDKTYDRYLQTLPDVAEKATTVQTLMDSDDMIDNDADDLLEAVDALNSAPTSEGQPQA